MGRFDPGPGTDDLTRQALARIEQTLSSLVDSLSALSALPTPVVNVPELRVPDVQVNTSVPTEGLVNAFTRAMQEAVAALPAPPTPSVSLDGVTADVDLMPLIEVAQQQQEVLSALKEKLSNLVAGNRSHFDGRLRTDTGPLSATNRLPVVGGGVQPDGDTVPTRSNGFVEETSVIDGLDSTGASALQPVDGVWSSPIFDSDGWEHLELIVRSDVTSADNGLIVRWFEDSTDDTTEVVRDVLTYDTSNAGRPFRLPVMADGFSVEYTNGSTAQAEFWLLCTLHITPAGQKLLPLGSQVGALDESQLVQVVRAVLEPVRNVKITLSSPTTSFSQAVFPPLARRKAVRIGAPVSNTKNVLIATDAIGTNFLTLEPGRSEGFDWGPEVDIYIAASSGSGSPSVEIVEEA